MFKRILVPLDGSRSGLRALKYATGLAQNFGAEIILLQVVKQAIPLIDVGTPAGSTVAVEVARMEDRRNVTRARRYLSGKVRQLKSRGITASYNVKIGDPALVIVAFSRKEKMDLIVMSTRGKSGIKRAIMGSVADAVIRKSGKPVLVIKP